MTLLSVLLLLAILSESNGTAMFHDYIKVSISHFIGQCCYLYGSVSRNVSNCVPEGDQLPLTCIVHNPRDSYTTLSVRWFRSSGMSAPAEDITDIQSTLSNHTQTLTSLQRNCTQGALYADTFPLIIHNFTADKDGYYWCQILINDSFTQPSQRAWFYTEESYSSCTRRVPYFRAVPNSAQCASGKPLTNWIIAF